MVKILTGVGHEVQITLQKKFKKRQAFLELNQAHTRPFVNLLGGSVPSRFPKMYRAVLHQTP